MSALCVFFNCGEGDTLERGLSNNTIFCSLENALMSLYSSYNSNVDSTHAITNFFKSKQVTCIYCQYKHEDQML